MQVLHERLAKMFDRKHGLFFALCIVCLLTGCAAPYISPPPAVSETVLTQPSASEQAQSYASAEEIRRLKEADYWNAVAERNADLETLDRLSETAVTSYDGELFSVEPMEGFLYEERNGLDFYRNGLYCGSLIGPYDAMLYPHDMEKEELFGEAWKSYYWEAELPSFDNMRTLWSFMKEVSVAGANSGFSYLCYIYEGKTEPYVASFYRSDGFAGCSDRRGNSANVRAILWCHLWAAGGTV